MILNSLKLKNIRSYKEQEITFPQGSIMLSGDIGAGKTTILLSVEFALFGIIRGQLMGSTLLRYGKTEGYVELNFNIEKTNIIIRRELRKNKKSINQDSGYIIVNGVKQDLTPVELKSKILELIGYPDELLTKSKSLIYRYTVYTPQEDMKQILLEKPNERLDVLRKIFDIDKYNRIKENINSYLKELRTTISVLQAKSEDLVDRKKDLLEYKNKILQIDENIKLYEKNILEIKKEFEEKEIVLKSYDEEIKEINNLQNKLQIKNSELQNKQRNITNNKQETLELKSKVEALEKELVGKELFDIEKLKLERKDIEIKILTLEKNIEKIKDRESTFKAMTNNSEEIIKKISSLDTCPVCEQKVDSEYKKRVHQREHQKATDVKLQLEKLNGLKEQRVKELFVLKQKLNAIDTTIRSADIIILKKKQQAEYKNSELKLIKEQENNLQEIKKTQEEIILIQNKLKENPDVLKKQSKEKEELETIRNKLKSEEIKQAELKREKQTIESVSNKLQEEINKKEESKKKLAKIEEVKNWLLKYLINIVYMMEKQIMLRIHQEFTEYFQEWFNTLIEDENLNVRLDETFTPIIEQNGYETYLENLSGGERTSVALAYRLALNRVINNFISTIKTKDLLILDEPTDGFSSEQLDKIRDVLEKLLIKQIILVSHEPKLESYVDNIIRIYKEEHVSRLLA